VPDLTPPLRNSTILTNEYTPDPLTLLSYLATTVFRVSSLSHAVAARRAQSRSVQEPEFGLREGREGVLIGLRGVSDHGHGHGHGHGQAWSEKDVVVDMEMRRRSGRAVVDRFILAAPTSTASVTAKGVRQGAGGAGGWSVMLWDVHPAFRGESGDKLSEEGTGGHEDGMTTFNIGLTEKQRRDREGVVLPYFDAQVEVGGGEGGRILYEMGREDDFDEEEDEI
jgi:elongator complex protein 5